MLKFWFSFHTRTLLCISLLCKLQSSLVTKFLRFCAKEHFSAFCCYNSAFRNLIARLILNTKCKIAVFTLVIVFVCAKPNIVHLVAVKNQDILNDDALHFKPAWSVLKIASFEFASLQYFNSTFINLKIARLVLNVKCEVVHVHAVFTSVILLWYTKYRSPCHLYSYAYKYKWKKYSKLRKHTFKNIHKFFKSRDGLASLSRSPRPFRQTLPC